MVKKCPSCDEEIKNQGGLDICVCGKKGLKM